LDLELELVVLDPGIALKGNAVDHRVLGDIDDNSAARGLDPHLLEQASGHQRLVRFVDLKGADPAVRPRLEIRADGVGLDPPISFDNDGARGLCIGHSRRHDRRCSSEHYPR
jgi:hypothetical protein